METKARDAIKEGRIATRVAAESMVLCCVCEEREKEKEKGEKMTAGIKWRWIEKCVSWRWPARNPMMANQSLYLPSLSPSPRNPFGHPTTTFLACVRILT